MQSYVSLALAVVGFMAGISNAYAGGPVARAELSEQLREERAEKEKCVLSRSTSAFCEVARALKHFNRPSLAVPSGLGLGGGLVTHRILIEPGLPEGLWDLNKCYGFLLLA